MKRNNKKGFTLAELLIVVAIIAVLVAIAIPVFNSQLEKAREGADLANIRAAYAEAMVETLDSSDGKATAYSDSKMQSTGTFDKVTEAQIGAKDIKSQSVTKGYYAKVDVDASDTTADPTVTVSFVQTKP